MLNPVLVCQHWWFICLNCPLTDPRTGLATVGDRSITAMASKLWNSLPQSEFLFLLLLFKKSNPRLGICPFASLTHPIQDLSVHRTHWCLSAGQRCDVTEVCDALQLRRHAHHSSLLSFLISWDTQAHHHRLLVVLPGIWFNKEIWKRWNWLK